MNFKRQKISVGNAVTTLAYELPRASLNKCGPFTCNRSLKRCLIIISSTLFIMTALSYFVLVSLLPCPKQKPSTDLELTSLQDMRGNPVTTRPIMTFFNATNHHLTEIYNGNTTWFQSTKRRTSHAADGLSHHQEDFHRQTPFRTNPPTSTKRFFTEANESYRVNFRSSLTIRPGKILSNRTKAIYVMEVPIPVEIHDILPPGGLKISWADKRDAGERARQPVTLKCRMRVWKERKESEEERREKHN